MLCVKSYRVWYDTRFIGHRALTSLKKGIYSYVLLLIKAGTKRENLSLHSCFIYYFRLAPSSTIVLTPVWHMTWKNKNWLDFIISSFTKCSLLVFIGEKKFKIYCKVYKFHSSGNNFHSFIVSLNYLPWFSLFTKTFCIVYKWGLFCIFKLNLSRKQVYLKYYNFFFLFNVAFL